MLSRELKNKNIQMVNLKYMIKVFENACDDYGKLKLKLINSFVDEEHTIRYDTIKGFAYNDKFNTIDLSLVGGDLEFLFESDTIVEMKQGKTRVYLVTGYDNCCNFMIEVPDKRAAKNTDDEEVEALEDDYKQMSLMEIC